MPFPHVLSRPFRTALPKDTVLRRRGGVEVTLYLAPHSHGCRQKRPDTIEEH